MTLDKPSEAFTVAVESGESRLFARVVVEPSAIRRSSRFDLGNDAVASLVKRSDACDWLYIPQEDVFSYRPNLLIRLQGNSAGHDYTIHFGSRKAGTVQFLERAKEMIPLLPETDEEQEIEAILQSPVNPHTWR